MIIDSSVVVAITRAEPDAERYAVALAAASHVRMSAANWLESAIVVDSARDPVASRRFDELVDTIGVEIVSVSESQVSIARQAYRDFGKGSGHRAGLNFGDCFAYALATELREPLLYKGDDFVHTEVVSAI